MIYRVHHATRYAYGTPVELGAHLLHLRPRELPHQHVLHSRLLVSPRPVRRRDGVDHFGNDATWLFLERRHPEFEVVAESQVEVRFPEPPAAEATPAWEAVAAAARAGGPGAWQAAEYLFAAGMAATSDEAGAYVAASFPPGRPVLSGLLDLNARIGRDFRFHAGVTGHGTPVAQVLQRREGVCQDFAHLMISGLRAIGLPARYVSGYLRTRPPPGEPRRRGADQSHAWVGAWLGAAQGWVDLDPTNGLVVRDEHVVLGWGRDYGDVSPVRGVILGGGRHEVSVGVDMEPLYMEPGDDVPPEAGIG